MTFTPSLKNRLAPNTVAVIGASQRPQSLGTLVWDAARQSQSFKNLIAVNPKYESLTGYTCLKDIKLLSNSVDTAIVSINAEKTIPTLPSLIAKKCQLAVIVSEANAYWKQHDILEGLEALKATSCRVLGPGSYGYMLPGQKVNLSIWPTLPKPGNIALIAQTGAIASMVLDDFRDTEVGFSSVITTGAENDISAAELIEIYAEDKNTRVIAVEFARVQNPRALFSALHQASRHKRVVVLASHLPASSRTLIDAVLKKTGVCVTESMEDFIACVAALASNKLPRGNRLAVVYVGGYLGARSTQAALSYGAILARPNGKILRELQTAKLTNSIDNPIVLKGEIEQALRALPLLLQDDNVDAILLLVAPSGTPQMPIDLGYLFNHITGSQKPVLSVWFSDRITRLVRDEVAQHLNAPLSVYQTIPLAARAFAALVAKNAQTLDRHGVPFDRPERLQIERLKAIRTLIQESVEEHHFFLNQERTESLAYLLGITSPHRVLAKGAEEIPTLGATLGWPLWLQFGAKGLETLVTGVAVYTPSETLGAWEKAKTELTSHSLDTPKVTAQVLRYQAGFTNPLSVELLQDPIVGPVLTCHREHSEKKLLLPLPLNCHNAYSSLLAADYLDLGSDEVKKSLALVLTRISDAVASVPALIAFTFYLVYEGTNWQLRNALVRLANASCTADATYSHLLLPPAPLTQWQEIETPKGLLHLRPLLDGDFGAISGFITRLSDKSLYLRFHTRSAMTKERVAQFYEYDPIRESTWVIADDKEIHAVANWHKDINSAHAEFGIVVEDHWQRIGLAKVLMSQLISTAKTAGVTKLLGFVLKGNEGMRMTMQKLGFTKENSDSNDTDTWSLTF